MSECKGELPEGWYRDRQALYDEYVRHSYSLEAVAKAHGPKPVVDTLRRWWRRLELPEHKPGPKTSLTHLSSHLPSSEDAPTELEKAVLKYLDKMGDSATVEELADLCDVSPRRIRDVIEHLGHNLGYRVEVNEEKHKVELRRSPPQSDNVHAAQALFDGDLVRFAIISDTHLGSNHMMLEELHIAYERVKIEGIDTVYHPGDLVCGYGVYAGQQNDVFLHTLEAQIDYAIEHYPRVEGITTRIIGGNHDLEGQFGRIGANPVKAVCNARDDMIYDGDYHAWYEFPQGTLMYVVHPKGGSSYARSYKMQKFAEAFDLGRKPNVLVAGHYHDALFLPNERGIQMLKAGCFESNGNLGVRVPLRAPATGFWIVEMRIAEDASVVEFDPRWRPFYNGRKAVVPVTT